jgi:hypothetical protein
MSYTTHVLYHVGWPPIACSRHADVFGDHEMVCHNSDKLTHHNNIVGALIIGSGLAGLSARLSNVLEMRRRPPDGRVDPSDQSKTQADLVVGPFTVPAHACSDTSLEIVVDACACHPTATVYTTKYALSWPGQCGEGANVIENRKIDINKERKARTGYAFNAFGAVRRDLRRARRQRQAPHSRSSRGGQRQLPPYHQSL